MIANISKGQGRNDFAEKMIPRHHLKQMIRALRTPVVYNGEMEKVGNVMGTVYSERSRIGLYNNT